MTINIKKTFLPIELYFVDNAKKTLSRFAITDNLSGLLDILQIILDSCENGLKNVVILDPARPGKVASAAQIGEYYGLRKRSFDEKINNIKTYNAEALNNA